MRYAPLIPQSPPVSGIGLGTWQLGENSGWQSMSEQEAIRMVRRALALRVNFFDTSPNYGMGTSELRLGKALKGIDRNTFVVNTKFGHAVSGELNFDPQAIRPSIEGSLRRLQLDYVDSVLLHNPPPELLDGSMSDHYEVLEQLKKEGKIRAYGASVDTAREMNLLMDHTRVELMEVFFNILHQDAARAFDRAKDKGLEIIVKIPLDSGWLSGKYDEHSEFQGIRARWSREDIAIRAALVRRVKEIIGDDRDLAQMALAFCLAHDAVATVIPGSSRIAQLERNVENIDRQIPQQLVKQLKQVYQQEVQPFKLPW